jgi:PncC family amidohydrolase
MSTTDMSLGSYKSLGTTTSSGLAYNFDTKQIEGDAINTLTLPVVENYMLESAAALKDTLLSNRLNVVTAESLTSGQIIKTLADIPGGGAALYGGFCTYDTDAKRKMIGVRTQGVYCAETAKQMAEGALLNSRAMVALAVTGNSMPYYDHKEHLGEVWFSVSIRMPSKSPSKSPSKQTSSNPTKRHKRKSTRKTTSAPNLYKSVLGKSGKSRSRPFYTRAIRFDCCKVLNMPQLCKMWIDAQPDNKSFAPPQLTYYINKIIRSATVAYALNYCKYILDKTTKKQKGTLEREVWDTTQKPSWIIEANLDNTGEIPKGYIAPELDFSPGCETPVF